jgi:outer membrane protein TolC
MKIAIYLLLALQTPTTDTLRLSLPDAVRIARDSNHTVRAERADARASAQQRLEATRAFLPNVRVELQGLRTTDPVAVFGFKLRQEVFGPQDFELAALNRPDPLTSYSTSLTIEQPILAPEGWFGYRAASRAAKAKVEAANRAAGVVEFMVRQAYWDALLADRRVDALDTAFAAVRAHARQAEALRAQGLVTGLDARLARIAEAEIEAQRLAAIADAQNALTAMRAMLGMPEGQAILLTDSLGVPEPSSCGSSEAECSIGDRGDLQALNAAADAASAVVGRAWASNLPSVAAFGAVARYGQSSPWGDGSGDWTIGVGLSWRPFQALSGVGAVRRAKAEREAAVARREGAERQAEVEVLTARRTLTAAEARLAVARRADGEAREALEQARLRYRTGAAPITELLDVQSAATSTSVKLLQARRDLLMAQAALEFAYGVYDR